MTARDIVEKYIAFFEKKGHRRIPNAPLVPQNDPTTLFTSSGMQPLVPYLLGEEHPMGKKLVNVQNCFRAQDIDEVGDNRHTTFFRMLGNWSLGAYFKEEQLHFFWEFLTKELGLSKERLYVSIFNGYKGVPKDVGSHKVWKDLGLQEDHIFFYGADKNWWSRAGTPEQMPIGEIGGPDSEVFYDFGVLLHDLRYGKEKECDPNCDCGRFLEIGNSVFMQYQKQEDGSLKELSQRNVDFGGGVERLIAATEDQQDIFQTDLFGSMAQTIELLTNKKYEGNKKEMRIITDHFIASVFIISQGIIPSNKEQGYILRRLIRRGLDHFDKLGGADLTPILEKIVEQYKDTDKVLTDKFEEIKNTILEEQQRYNQTLQTAKHFIFKKYSPRGEAGKVGDELKGVTEISADDAFILYTTHGLSPTQIKSLGFVFNNQEFAEKMKAHQNISRAGAKKKFAGGLADHSEKTIMGHTATHLLHQALRDVLGNHVFQTGSNITSERIRFDFNYEKALTPDEIKKVENIVNEKILENLPVHFEMLPLKKAKEIGAIGLFDGKYEEKVKIYFIGPSTSSGRPYSAEFCGGPHVSFTSEIKSFRIIKQENIGKGVRRIYSKVGE
ncbi:MAG: alanine--tRNA ligase [Candidatus Levybacteria bacterium]|nr:alanine--tRNA ligase [Candidatus Levybacteria bacterium]